MFRKFLAIVISLSLCWTMVGCGSSTTTTQTNSPSVTRNNPPVTSHIADGQYPIQQATYNDADGEYTLMLLNTPAGSSPVFRSTNLQMARLTDEEIKAGKKSYLNVSGGQPVMYITEDFKIEYVHNVTQTQTNPQTGQTETVIVRQQSSFWSPFLGALAGQAIGSMLFTPHYYVPPVYQPGGVLVGYGGYGRTYNDAVSSYQSRYQTLPPAVKNRQTFRSTGSLRSPSYNNGTRRTTSPSTTRNQPTGSGYGGSTLRRSGSSSSPSRTSRPSGFGSSRRTPARSGGFRRR